jgi:hypothetical protein
LRANENDSDKNQLYGSLDDSVTSDERSVLASDERSVMSSGISELVILTHFHPAGSVWPMVRREAVASALRALCAASSTRYVSMRGLIGECLLDSRTHRPGQQIMAPLVLLLVFKRRAWPLSSFYSYSWGINTTVFFSSFRNWGGRWYRVFRLMEDLPAQSKVLSTVPRTNRHVDSPSP